jgi:Eco57I restriction-modification methylase
MQQPDINHRNLTLQIPEQIDTLVKQLKPVLGSIHKQVRAQFTLHQQHYADYQRQASYTNATMNCPDYMLSKQVSEVYNAWQAGVGDSLSNPEAEFCLQTTYMHFVRIFFVRACEDYGLISACLTHHDTSVPDMQACSDLLSHISATYFRLLKQIYRRASVDHDNPFYHQGSYDWFTADEQAILALYTLLNYFSFKGPVHNHETNSGIGAISRKSPRSDTTDTNDTNLFGSPLGVDILGRVYNEGYIANKERSTKGQFYTSPQVVDYMLDSLGIPTFTDISYGYKKCINFLEKTVGDLSCGSGSFLVAAAARKRYILQRLVIDHEVSPAYALQILANTFLGFDLNPFACYLAEMNMLMQCLPFLIDEQGQLCRSVECFHIYGSDILEPTINEQTCTQANGKINQCPGSRSPLLVLSDEEQRIMDSKDAKGLPDHLMPPNMAQYGLDYLVGNPPYVSAGESPDSLPYRTKVWNSGIYTLLYQRWDLFVPFFERNLQFLHPETGRLSLIVSNGIETEGYAERLRQALTNQYRLLQIDFFPGLRLFQNAAVENTIVLLENRAPDDQHEVIRRKHLQADCKHFETLPPILQLSSNSQIFRWRYDPALDKSVAEGCIPLCSIVYIGTGVEAQSDEDADPVINGKRQKRFTLNDVFLASSVGGARPEEYIDEGVLGDDVGRYYLRRKRYVAYEKFRPQMRGPRHIALFRTPEKLLLGETSGGYYDRAGLLANHSVQVVVSWKALEQAGVLEEKGIRTVLRKSRQITGIINSFSPIAELFDLRYLLAIINSHFMRAYLTSNMHEGTRKARIYPDVWKRLPIKVASAKRQQQIAILVDAVQEQCWRSRVDLNALLSEIETLVEKVYRESADAEMMDIINSRLASRVLVSPLPRC